MKDIQRITPNIKNQLTTLRNSLNDKEKLVLGSFMGVIFNYKNLMGLVDECESQWGIITNPIHTAIAAPSIYNIIGCIDHETREAKASNNNWQIVYIEELVANALNGDINALRIIFHSNGYATPDIEIIRKGILDAFSNKFMRARFLINNVELLKHTLDKLWDEVSSNEEMHYTDGSEIKQDEILCCILNYVCMCICNDEEVNRDTLNKKITYYKHDIVESSSVNISFLHKMEKQYEKLDDKIESLGIYEYNGDEIDTSIMMYRYSIMKPLVSNILDESGLLRNNTVNENDIRLLVTQQNK